MAVIYLFLSFISKKIDNYTFIAEYNKIYFIFKSYFNSFYYLSLNDHNFGVSYILSASAWYIFKASFRFNFKLGVKVPLSTEKS